MKKRFLSHLENSLFQSVIIRKVCFRVTKKRFLSDSEYSFLRAPKRRKMLESCFGSMKWRFVSDSENSVFQGWQNGNRFIFFWRSDKAIRLRFGNFDFSGRQNARSAVNVVLVPWKIDFFRIRKIPFFRVITLKILYRLLWGNEKPISFGFGIITFSGREKLQIASKLFWRSEKVIFFRIRKIRFSRALKRYKSRQGYNGSPKN